MSPAASPSSRDGIAGLLQGLLSLEINTIEKDGMSGQKMPDAPDALIDLSEQYWTYLCEKANRFGSSSGPLRGWPLLMSVSFPDGLSPFPAAADADTPPGALRRPEGHLKDFLRNVERHTSQANLDELRGVASWLVEMETRVISARDGANQYSDALAPFRIDIIAFADKIGSEERSVLHRIRRNCDQLKELSLWDTYKEVDRKTPDTNFSAQERVLIRKAWDIGVETILLQTVVQLDGDVVFRFQKGTDRADRQGLQNLHQAAVDLSFRYWRNLIDTVTNLTEGAIRLFSA